MTEHSHRGWTIRVASNCTLAVRGLGKERVGLARKRGETPEELLERTRGLIDNYESAVEGNAFLRTEIDRSI